MEQVKHKLPEALNEFREVFGTLTYDRGEWQRQLMREAGIDPESQVMRASFTGWVRVAWDRTGIVARGYRARRTFRLCGVSQVIDFVELDTKAVR